MSAINKLPIDPQLPGVELTREYLTGLNKRLYELFPQIAHTINLATGGYSTLFTVTANYTASQGDQIILVDCSGGARTVTLPAASAVANKTFRVKKVDSSGNTLTVQASAGNIDGAASKVWSTALQGFGFVSDGANYWVI